jgi:imidazole glycerol-phosphate synthase subunit HisH
VKLAIVDVGCGNIGSVGIAFERFGIAPLVTGEAEEIAAADKVVLPGVGAAGYAMEQIDARGLTPLLRALRQPVLGICLGMQLLFDRSEELGGAEGLGVIPGEVRLLAAPGLKLPQIGWNAVGWRRPSAITDGLPQPCAFYHVHSFAPVPADPDAIVGTATYGEEFASVVARGRVFGVQFHPEKSGPDGLALLARFVRAAAVGGDAPDETRRRPAAAAR